MTENEPQLPEKIRKALKESPSLTPPESFYRGVLDDIALKKGRAPERPWTDWLWGYPAKGLAAACVLMVIVLVMRDHSSQTKISEWAGVDQANKLESHSRPEPSVVSVSGQAKMDSLKDSNEPLSDLAGTQEVQSRIHGDISKLVDNPSPFDEEDAALRKDLDQKNSPPSSAEKAKGQSAPAASAYMQQARDTTGGAATQDSFQSQRQVLAGKKSEGVRTRAAFVLSTTPDDDAAQGGEGVATQRKVRAALGYTAATKSLALPKESPAAASPVMVAQNTVNGMATNASFMNQAGGLSEWAGASSGIVQFKTVAVRTPEEWAALWREHSKIVTPAPPLPAVDFNSSMVVGIFDGAKPTGGYSVYIMDIQTSVDKVVILYRESNPPAGMATIQAFTQPYDLRIIPKTALPIIFQKVQ